MWDDSVLLSGSPALLEDFIQAYKVNASRSAVHAPFHASHLFSENDVERIVHSFPPSLAAVTSKHTLLSHLNGKAAPPQTLHSLLAVAVSAILREHVASYDAFFPIREVIQAQVAQPCTIVSIGTPNGSKLAAMLGKTDFDLDDVIFEDDESIVNAASTPQHARQPKIAMIP